MILDDYKSFISFETVPLSLGCAESSRTHLYMALILTEASISMKCHDLCEFFHNTKKLRLKRPLQCLSILTRKSLTMIHTYLIHVSAIKTGLFDCQGFSY